MCVCLKCDRKKYKPQGAFYLAFDDEDKGNAEKYTFCKAGYWKNGKMLEEFKDCKKFKKQPNFRYVSEWGRRYPKNVKN